MDTTDTSFRLGYRPALDGLRAVAILLVMGFHAKLTGMQAGGLGVDLFFVLSGFLITTIVVQEFQRTNKIDLRRFYLRRVLRLLPALLLLVAVFLAISAVLGQGTFLHTFQTALLVITYVANWAMIYTVTENAIFSHTWSLSIEEQFYTLFPLVMGAVLPRFSLQRLRIALLIGIGLITLWRGILVFNGAPWYRIYYGIDTHADALLWGSWLALMVTTTHVWQSTFWIGWARHSVVPAVIAFVILVMAADLHNALQMVVVFPAVAVLATILLFYLLTTPGGWLHRLMASRPFVGIGKVSYGLYLWHPPIYNLMFASGITISYVLVFGTFITIVMTLLSYYLVEKPCLRLSARLTNTANPVSSHTHLGPVAILQEGAGKL